MSNAIVTEYDLRQIADEDPEMIWDVCRDSTGNLWFATYGAGVFMYNGTEWTQFTTADGLESNNNYTLTIGPGNSIWVASYSGLCVYFEGEWWKIIDFHPDMGESSIYAMAFDQTGNLWVGCNGYGLFMNDTDGEWHRYRNNVLPDENPSYWVGRNSISAIEVDANNNVWVASELDVRKIENGTATSYRTVDDFVLGSVYSILADSIGNVWFSGSDDDKLIKYSDGIWTKQTNNIVSFGHENQKIKLGLDKGTMWSSKDDLYYNNGANWESLNIFDYRTDLFDIEVDPKGYIWVTSKNIIYKVEKKDIVSQYFERSESLVLNISDGLLTVPEELIGNVYRMSSIDGSLVGTGKCSANGISVGHLQSGIYIFQTDELTFKLILE